MSTKATIAHGPTFHLADRGSAHHEVFDDRFVYLRLDGAQPGPLRAREASYDRVTVPIPVHVWEHVRQFPGVDLSLADAADDELRADAEAYVDERIARYEAAETDPQRALANVVGSLGYGPADAPREEQVALGVEDAERRRTYQREVRAAIERLRPGSDRGE